ncbi:MAG: hypothetical protein RL641_393 [Candidatus Parcubacteria bacterium]|jgi:hypothetical protein
MKKHDWFIPTLIATFILQFVGFASGQSRSSGKDFKNIAFQYDVFATGGFFNPSTETQTINWNPGFKRYLGSRMDEGGFMYLGLDYNSKLWFKYLDTLGAQRSITTSSAGISTGLAIQSNLSKMFAGSCIKVVFATPIENTRQCKFIFGTMLQLNINFPAFNNYFEEANLLSILLEIGAVALNHNVPGVNPTIWTERVGVGIAYKVPNKKRR